VWFVGKPLTPGFDSVRMPAVGIGVGLELDDSFVAWGDAVSVQYPGVADRDPPMRIDEVAAALRDRLAPALVGLRTDAFRAADERAAVALAEQGLTHKAVAFGLSQALLAAAAHATRRSMAETICDEFGLPLRLEPVPIFAQTGDRPRENVDKMILKGVDVLPHGLVNNLEKFGADGEAFLEYVGWTARRVGQLSPWPGYAPVLHFDLYGIAGEVFGEDTDDLCAYLARCADAARPYRLRIETPVIADSRDRQIERLRAIRETLRRERTPVELLADEWCNTLEDIRAFASAQACDMVQIKMPDLGSVADSIVAVRACHEAGIRAYLGGSCAETELSARVAVHVAIATQADVQLAKPGMGVDEGLMIVANEQARLLAELRAR
jgi:methylaspartate ammonia-lyase